MAGYIGSKSSVTQVDGYTEAEADAEFVTKTGDTMTGDLSFGDNDKAIFGAGDDLQIYHDGSHSYVKDAGTGNLKIQGENVAIENTSGDLALYYVNTGVNLYHNGSAKLATTSTGANIRGDGDTILLLNTASDAGDKSLIRFGDNDDADAGYIDYDHGTNALAFGVNAAERLRIDASGNVLVGGANAWTGQSNTTGLQIGPLTNFGTTVGTVFEKTSNEVRMRFSCNSSSGRTLVYFYNPNGHIGSIVTSGSSTSYVTSSDYRLKENVVDLTGASARVNQLNPSRFNFIADETNTLVDGFLAHEVATVVPEAITGTHDGMKDEEYEVTPAVEATYDDDGNELTAAVEAVMGTRSVPDYQGIDQSKLVPLLTAALQEALTEIASLKTRVEALEA